MCILTMHKSFSAVIHRKCRQFMFYLPFSAPDEVDNYAKEILEAMEVASQQGELKNEDIIATLEAEFEQEKHQKVQLNKISSP